MLIVRKQGSSSSSTITTYSKFLTPRRTGTRFRASPLANLSSGQTKYSSCATIREIGQRSSQYGSSTTLPSKKSASRGFLIPSSPRPRTPPLLPANRPLSSSHFAARAFSYSAHLHLSSSIRAFFATTSSERSPRAPFEFLVGYAFAGKPRGESRGKEIESESESESENEDSKTSEIGFPPDSDVGRWRDSLLGGGEAGEDALMCAGMGLVSSSSQYHEDGIISEGGDVVLGVADGVGGWVENGVDPSLFSQALMYHATTKAARHLACPERVEDLATEGVSSASSSTSSDSNLSSSSSSTTSSRGSTSGTSFSTSVSGHPGSPLSLLQYAYDKVLEEDLVEAGSATACIVTLDSSKGVLRSANLGDSGFLILRQGSGIHSSQIQQKEERAATSQRKDKDTPTSKSSSSPSINSSTKTISRGRRPSEGVLFASDPLQLGFNCPLQLAKLPKHLAQEGSISNVPGDSALWECRLRDGDIVLLGTDGLFDNVFQSEIVQLTRFIREKHHSAWTAKHGSKASSSANKSITDSHKTSSSQDSVLTSTSTSSSLSSSDSNPTSSSESAQRGDGLIQDDLAEERAFIEVLAHNLVEYTRMCQFSQTKKSPFEREAERYGMRYPGGKVDDVAVCLALVKER